WRRTPPALPRSYPPGSCRRLPHRQLRVADSDSPLALPSTVRRSVTTGAPSGEPSKPRSKPSLGSLIRKHFHDFRYHFLVAPATEPAEAPLVVAAQGMFQHVEKAFVTVGARRVFGSGPSFFQQHRQVRVGKERPRD